MRLRDVATGKSQTYKLVGNMTDEDTDHVEVTSSSPLGIALMKARVGETVRADLPRGERRFEIVEILE